MVGKLKKPWVSLVGFCSSLRIFIPVYNDLLFFPNTAVQDNVWYNFYSRNITSWTGGQKQCEYDGGQLVTLETERKWQFVNEEIQKLSNPAKNEWFIGLKAGYWKRQNWQWITGEPLTNPHWQRNEPSGDGQCVIIAKEYPSGTYGNYNDLSCQSLKGFICEVNETTGNNSNARHGSSHHFKII